MKSTIRFFENLRIAFDILHSRFSVDNKSSLSDHLSEFKLMNKEVTEMSMVEQLDSLIEIAQQIGYRVRYDYFGGTGGGLCQVNGAKWLFIDVALSTSEQVERLTQALSEEPLYHVLAHSSESIKIQKAA